MVKKQTKVPNKSKAVTRSRPKRSNKKSRIAPMYKAVVNQLVDPCGCMPFSPYQGERGVVQRFVSDITLNTFAGNTAGFVMLVPGANSWLNFSTNNSATPASPANFVGPGAAFLGASASKMRSCGGCITTIPSSVSITNMTGEIGMAIVTASQLSTLTPVSVDGVFQLTNIRKVLKKTEYETKWFPGGLDHTYAPVLNTGGFAGSATLSDPSDQNAILVAYRGYPPGVALSFRLTNIIEWTPVVNIGLSVTSAPAIGLPVKEIAAVTHAAEPSWWHTHSKEITHSLGEAGNNLLNAGIKVASDYAVEAMIASAA